MADAVLSGSEERSHDPAGSWAALFQHSSQATFLLSRHRRFRRVNPAWVSITGQPPEAILGKIAKSRSALESDSAQQLANALHPPAEVLEGIARTVRRQLPARESGPPWWDISYLPLQGANGLLGIIGTITVVDPLPASNHVPVIPAILMELRQTQADRYGFELLRSLRTERRRIAQQAQLAAESRHPVWIVGPESTGKETLARIIHFQGIQRERNFLPVDCAGLQPYLIRGLLFGKSGFTASPTLGTLYLKNASFLTVELQWEILEWYESQPNHARVIVGETTNAASLQSPTWLPEFRERFRLLVIETVFPNADEIEAIIETISAREGWKLQLSSDAIALLRQHPWTGGFEELIDCLRTARSAAGTGIILPNHLPLTLVENERKRLAAGPAIPRLRQQPISLEEVLQQVERKLIVTALERVKGNRAEAAEQLGIGRGKLLRRLEALGIVTE